MTLDLAHISMQYSDTEKQKKYDAAKIFDKGYDGITGTEAGEQPLTRILRVAAYEAGYTFLEYKSNWVSIHKSLILPGSYVRHAKTLVDNDRTAGPGHDTNVVGVTVKTKRLGEWSLLCSHLNTKGRPDGKPEYRVNLDENREAMRGIGDLADVLGAGRKLCFYGGDQNIVDKDNDTFFGEDFTSAWDELRRYENTGHGNIDVIASYDHDGRVEAKYIRALDDKEQHMFTDHFVVEAGFKVKLLAA